MGGSVYRGYDGFAYPTVAPKPMPEWNILCDVAAARMVFASGVPLYVMPLDSTQIQIAGAGKGAAVQPRNGAERMR